MTSFDWSVIDSQSFAIGMVWCVCCHLLIGIGDRLITAAFEGLERLGKKRSERRKATQKEEDQEHVR
jgi:hypothetical protein